MPQVAITYGLIGEEYRLPAQALEVGAIVYMCGVNGRTAVMAGGAWYLYNMMFGPSCVR
jgi:hypothetical protein